MRPPSRARSPAPDHENDAHESHGLLNHPSGSHPDDQDDHELHAEDGEEEGYSYPQGASIPQVIDRMESHGADNDVVFDGDEELVRKGTVEGEGQGEIIPYAHRDIKPA